MLAATICTLAIFILTIFTVTIFIVTMFTLTKFNVNKFNVTKLNVTAVKVAMFTVTRICCFFLWLLPIAAVNAKEATNQSTPITIGQAVTLYSSEVDETRRRLMSLPKSYQRANKRSYPVLYALDGDVHFSHSTGPVSWLSGFADKIPELLIVAIKNTDRDRDLSRAYNGGGSDKFLKFIKTEVITAVDNTYRTNNVQAPSGHLGLAFVVLDTVLHDVDILHS